MKYLCYNIKWDTDGMNPAKLGLPTKTVIDLPADKDPCPDDDLSNALSDQYGYCHFGFEFEEMK